MNFVPVLPLRASLWAPVFQVISSRNSVSEFSEFKIIFKIKIRPCRPVNMNSPDLSLAVVYFNQRLDATHSKRWLKYVFSLFFGARKLKKCKKRNLQLNLIKKCFFLVCTKGLVECFIPR